MKNFVIGIDLGGTKISTALSDLDGDVKSQITIPTDAHEGEIPVLNRIIETVEYVLKSANLTTDDIRAIGIGSPGPLDAKKGIIITTPNLPFKNFNLVGPIGEKFKLPVYLDNDANVAAIGEFMFGAGKGTENMVYFTVSTGVGGGAVLNGKIYRGNTSNALEIGHTTVVSEGPRCGCGNLGCLEAVASGTAIGKRGREAVESKVETSLKKYDTVTSAEVFKEAAAGDDVSKDIVNTALNYLGIGIANAIATFDPEVVIIGGGVSKAGKIVFDKVQEVVNKRCFKAMAEACRIVPAGLGTDAGVVGAVALAIMESNNLY
ncbi:glucokinase [Clostridium polyendosporum]|uniref:Glucokinase n=1 Tax=Clostridium polyendosporum TaxID=69208 RepID=A0A919VHT7_9CLOT|nr:ROK family protein [Clostridium polyendosporum]GIM30587.1 glucokinase [Clostridium polyendosporum]